MNIEFTVKESPDFILGAHIQSLPKEVHKPIRSMKEYKERNAIARAEVHGNGALQ